MISRLSIRQQNTILVLLTALTRIPFLFDGFGHEEDSWGLAVNSWEMHEWGHYVASRFPGHPLQEYVYSLIWNQPAWIYNSFSCVFSIIAVLAFANAMRKIGTGFAFEAALMLTFTPVFFAAGTYTIDFAWTLAFIMLSLWALLDRRLILCGVFIGFAIGCRITSAVFLLPWLLLIRNSMDLSNWIKDSMKICLPAAAIGILWFVPAWLQYGFSFFDYSDQFPYPPAAKIIYKASIGVFGLLGIAAYAYLKFCWLKRKTKSAVNIPSLVSPKRLTAVLFVIIILHVISYLRLPQKSGYLVPVIPFVIMLAVMFSESRQIRIATVIVTVSPFIFGFNLTDSVRGSDSSFAAVKFNLSGQEIFFDPLSGPIHAEQSKRRNKMKFTAAIREQIRQCDSNDVLICGWWYNELKTRYLPGMPGFESPNADLRFYESCNVLNSLRSRGKSIYYLPEQNLYNDQMFQQNCTDSIAKPFSGR